MAQCRETNPLPEAIGQRCPYNVTEGSNRYCYWHRLARTSLDAQVREAGRRLKRAQDVEGFEHRARVPADDWPTGERWCAGCQHFVPLWYCRGARCKGCATGAAREGHRERTFGVNPESWDAILMVQKGRCPICRKHQRDRSLAVEHNHKTGKVRGAACARCNHGLLGSGFDSPNIMLAGLVYLLAPPTSGYWLAPEDHGDELMETIKAKILEINERKAT